MADRTDTETLITALRVLARDIVSDDGVADAAIAEAAERLQQLALAGSEAAAILRAEAEALAACHCLAGEWGDEDDARQQHDEWVALAERLEGMA